MTNHINKFKSLIVAVFVATLLTSCVSTGTSTKPGFGSMPRSLNNIARGYQVVEDHTGSAPTPTIERFEVQDGDCGSEGGWSDCANDRERSELKQQGSTSSGTHWYGWSIYFPKDFPHISPVKSIFGQFHQRNSKSPAFVFSYNDNALILDGQLNGHYEPLIEEDDLRGKWHQIEVQVNWTKEWDKGFMKVWVNGELKGNYKGRTLTKGGGAYFKYGVYRTKVSEWKEYGYGEEVPTQILYYSNVRKSKTREGLQPGKP